MLILHAVSNSMPLMSRSGICFISFDITLLRIATASNSMVRTCVTPAESMTPHNSHSMAVFMFLTTGPNRGMFIATYDLKSFPCSVPSSIFSVTTPMTKAIRGGHRIGFHEVRYGDQYLGQHRHVHFEFRYQFLDFGYHHHDYDHHRGSR